MCFFFVGLDSRGKNTNIIHEYTADSIHFKIMVVVEHHQRKICTLKLDSDVFYANNCISVSGNEEEIAKVASLLERIFV